MCLPFTFAIFNNTVLALSNFPQAKSHLGDSGKFLVINLKKTLNNQINLNLLLTTSKKNIL